MHLNQSNQSILRSSEMNQGFKLKSYKGYIGSVVAEVELGYYWGKILDTEPPLEYEADTLEDLQEAFESGVEDYLRLTGRDEFLDNM